MTVFTNEDLKKFDDSAKTKYAEKVNSTVSPKSANLFEEMKDLYEDSIEILDKEGESVFANLYESRKYSQILSKTGNRFQKFPGGRSRREKK